MRPVTPGVHVGPLSLGVGQAQVRLSRAARRRVSLPGAAAAVEVKSDSQPTGVPRPAIIACAWGTELISSTPASNDNISSNIPPG
jgi:hypothetical protein